MYKEYLNEVHSTYDCIDDSDCLVGGKERGDQSCGTPIMLSWIRLRSVSTFIILTITCW